MTSRSLTPEPNEEEEGPGDAVLVTDADSETGQVIPDSGIQKDISGRILHPFTT